MKKILALGGAGHIGACGVRELVRIAPDMEVIIADYNLDNAQMLCAEVGGKTTAIKVDANDNKSLVAVMEKADVIVNTIGPYYLYAEKILRAAMQAKKNLVDVCDDGDATEKMIGLHDEAKKAGICAVICMGATPGITNMLARVGADKLDRVDDIDTAWAWSAIDPKMTGSAIMEHYFHAITGEVVTYRDGKYEKIKAAIIKKIIAFAEPYGLMEAAQVGHPEPVSIPKYIKGVKNVTNYGCIQPKTFSNMAELFRKMGVGNLMDIEVGGKKVCARDVGVGLILGLPAMSEEFVQEMIDESTALYGEFGVEGVMLRVDVRGEKNGNPAEYSYTCGSTADQLTALPSVICALMFARGQIKGSGVFAPEGIVDPKIFFAELQKDIKVREIASLPISL
jgi:saccharopine dehydrogenase (NAD+, L-lysine-forming)